MSADDVGIRAGADRPIETQVKTATAELLAEPCAHRKIAWRIDGELWHVRSVDRGQQFLVPCDSQLKLEAAR